MLQENHIIETKGKFLVPIKSTNGFTSSYLKLSIATVIKYFTFVKSHILFYERVLIDLSYQINLPFDEAISPLLMYSRSKSWYLNHSILNQL